MLKQTRQTSGVSLIGLDQNLLGLSQIGEGSHGGVYVGLVSF